ncbi:hypothetical protein RPPS3_25580 [Rhodopseudomonas palustris]|uniref:hypothetical protein n=1 Tax=Rhodopseudomonas palustris TaxID=1076 RepID=UPI000D199BD6|nr:hypothetical protein [Rhodopseudomonas palustris]AVT76621.1 hypothetical protein RPPS3_25580 [Rhodopseudomonas palustris]
MVRLIDFIDSEAMPAPDKIVKYKGGIFCPAMFHFAPEGSDYKEIARECGFDIATSYMERELDDDHPLMVRYFENGESETVLEEWVPEVREGWKLAGLYDTEDGPCALWIKPIEPAAEQPK